MSQKKYIVNLTEAEVKELETIIKTGKHSARLSSTSKHLRHLRQKCPKSARQYFSELID